MTVLQTHILPASLLFCLALHWIIQAALKLATILRKDDIKIRRWKFSLTDRPSTITTDNSLESHHQAECRLRHKMFNFQASDGIILISLASLGMAADLYAAFVQGQLNYLTGLFYATFYFLLGIAGIIDIIEKCSGSYLKKRGLKRCPLTIAFIVEGLLFYTHGDLYNDSVSSSALVSTESKPNILLTELLVFVIICCALLTLLDNSKRNLKPNFALGYCTFLQAMWLLQMVFLQQEDKQNGVVADDVVASLTDKDSVNSWLKIAHETEKLNLQWIGLLFGWHCAGAFLIVFCINLLIIRKCTKRKYPSMEEDEPLNPASSV